MQKWKSYVLACLLWLALLLPSGVLAEEDKYPWRDELFGKELAQIQIDGYAYYDQARSILGMVNELRSSLGLHPLVYNAQLEAAAMLRAAETSVLWSHMRPDGTFIYYTPPYNSENIAAGNSSPKKTFLQWVNSPSHYEAMVNPRFISIGIGAFGTAKGEPPLWWAQVFSAQVGGTEFSEHAEVERYRPAISLAPEMLRVRANASEAHALSWEQTFEDGKFAYRLPPGRELLLRPYVHYDVQDPFQVMTLLVPEAWTVVNLNPDILDSSETGKVRALKAGEGHLELSLEAYPEISCNYRFVVIDSEVYALNATLRPDLVPEIEEQMMKDSQAHFLEQAQEEASESSAAEIPAESESPAETESRLVEIPSLSWDSTLERYALEIAKHASLCESPNPVQDYPDLQMADKLLNPDANYWWLYYSSSDAKADQKIIAPLWAKAYGMAILDSDGEQFTAVVFSDQRADDTRLYTEAVPLRYPVAVYADRSDYQITLPSTVLNDQSLSAFALPDGEDYAGAPAGPLAGEGLFPSQELKRPLEARKPQGAYLFRPHLSSKSSPVHAEVLLDAAHLAFASSDVKILEVYPDGSFDLRGNGKVRLTIEVLPGDGLGATPLMQEELELEVQLERYVPTTSMSETSSLETTSFVPRPSEESVESEAAGRWTSYILTIAVPLLMLALVLYLVSGKKKEERNERER